MLNTPWYKYRLKRNNCSNNYLILASFSGITIPLTFFAQKSEAAT